MTAKGLNKVQIIGYLGATPEMRYTSQGGAVTTFRVAVNSQWRDTSGKVREEVEWFRVVTWDQQAENCNQFLDKGSKVYVEGRLKTRKWQDEAGQDRYITELVAKEVIFLNKASANGSGLDEEAFVEDAEDEAIDSPAQRQTVAAKARTPTAGPTAQVTPARAPQSKAAHASAPAARPPISSPPARGPAVVSQKAAPAQRKGAFEEEDLPL